MKVIMKKFTVILIAFFFLSINVNAIEITYDKLEQELESKNIQSEYIYVIGNYVFTGDYAEYDFPDIMLATRSIDLTGKEGAVKDTDAYKAMTIFYMTRNFNTSLLKYDKLVPEENIVGDTKLPDTLDIKYIDYEPIEKIYTVSFNDGENVRKYDVKEGDKVNKPSDPIDPEAKFLGWYLDGELYDFDKPVTKNIELDAYWMLYSDIYREASVKNILANSGTFTIHDDVIYNDGESIITDILIIFSRINNTLKANLTEFNTDPYFGDSVTELYEQVKDGKLYNYFKDDEEWYCYTENIDYLTLMDSFELAWDFDFKKAEKVESDLENYTKLKLIVDKDTLNSEDESIEFVNDMPCYAYVNEDGYVVKLLMNFKDSFSKSDQELYEKYERSITFNDIDQKNDFTIPEEIIKTAISLD